MTNAASSNGRTADLGSAHAGSNPAAVALTELRGGLFVRTDAIILALALEEAGHALTAKDGALLVGNGSTLTAEQRTAIQGLKRHL